MDEQIIAGSPPRGTYDVDLKGQRTIQFAVINASSSGDNTLVAADTGKTIRVLSYVFVAAGTVNITFKSGASTSLSGAMPFVVNAGAVAPPSSPAAGAYMQTAANQALVMNLSQAVAVTGHLSYYLE